MVEARNDLEAAIETIRPQNSAQPSNPVRNFANALRSGLLNSAARHPTRKISLSRGKTFPINDQAEIIIIGPRADAKERYPSSFATKTALQSTINPVKMKLRINKVIFGSESPVIIEGKGFDKPGFVNSVNDISLEPIGFESKEHCKINPRLVVHGVPAKLSEDEVRQSIIE